MSSFYMCTINHNHMVYACWDMGATHNFLSFWVTLYSFTPLLDPKIKNWKEIRRYFLFHMCKINKDSGDIRRNRQEIFVILGLFCHLILLTNQKIKILKKWEKTLEILSLYICLPQIIIILCTVPEIWSSRGKIFSHFGPFFALLLKN